MNTLRIRKTIDSETLHLPELGPFIGHTVDIVIEDRPAGGTSAAQVLPGHGEWDALLDASQQLEDYDANAQREQDVCDIRDAQDRMR